MSKNQFVVAMRFVHGGARDVHRHRLHFIPLDQRAGEKFHQIRTAGEFFAHDFHRLLGSGGLRKYSLNLQRQRFAHIKRQSIGRVQAGARREYPRTRNLSRVHAGANGHGVGEIRRQIDGGGDAVARKHVAHLLGEFRGRLVLGVVPFRFGEMNVTVLEAGGDHLSRAIDNDEPGNARVGGRSVGLNRDDLSAADRYRTVFDRRSRGRGINFGVLQN